MQNKCRHPPSPPPQDSEAWVSDISRALPFLWGCHYNVPCILWADLPARCFTSSKCDTYSGPAISSLCSSASRKKSVHPAGAGLGGWLFWWLSEEFECERNIWLNVKKSLDFNVLRRQNKKLYTPDTVRRSSGHRSQVNMHAAPGD